MLLLAMQRRLLDADVEVRRGEWGLRKTAGAIGCRSTGYSSTAVVLGFGAVGKQIGKVLMALGTEVLAVRRRGPGSIEEMDDVCTSMHGPDELADLLPKASALILAAPLTPATASLISTELLMLLPDGATVVNVGRAEVVVEDAIWEEVDSGRLNYAADVWWNEGQLASKTRDGEKFYGSVHPFHKKDNVLITPHYGGAVGLPGIEEARVEAVLATIIGAADATVHPLDLSLGY